MVGNSRNKIHQAWGPRSVKLTTTSYCFFEVVCNDGERIVLHNAKHRETVTLAEELEGVTAIAAKGNLVAAAIASLGEIWMIQIGVSFV